MMLPASALILLGLALTAQATPMAKKSGSGGKQTLNVHLVTSVFYTPGSGNKMGTGYAVDLLNALEKVTSFKFTIKERPELTYPSRTTGSFDGSILQPLLSGEADMVGPDLTMTVAGDAVAEFLRPLIRYSLRILTNPNGIDADTKWVIQNTEDLDYLRNSKNATLKAIYDNINANMDDQVINTDEDGLAKVINGNYAYIVEDFHVNNLLKKYQDQIQLLNMPNGLGGYFFESFAVAQGSPLRQPLNTGILTLIENGTIKTLLQKYNFYNNVPGSCPR